MKTIQLTSMKKIFEASSHHGNSHVRAVVGRLCYRCNTPIESGDSVFSRITRSGSGTRYYHVECAKVVHLI